MAVVLERMRLPVVQGWAAPAAQLTSSRVCCFAAGGGGLLLWWLWCRRVESCASDAGWAATVRHAIAAGSGGTALYCATGSAQRARAQYMHSLLR